MIRKKPISAVERVVQYAEFAAEFGHIENIDLASTKLNFFQYYLLDILIPFFIISIVTAVISAIITVKIFVWLLRKIIFRAKVKND